MNDKELLFSMRELIEEFEAGKVEIQVLLRSLKRSFENIERKSEEFSDSFFDHWGLVEEIHAVHLSRNASTINGEDADRIRTSLHLLKERFETASLLGLEGS